MNSRRCKYGQNKERYSVNKTKYENSFQTAVGANMDRIKRVFCVNHSLPRTVTGVMNKECSDVLKTGPMTIGFLPLDSKLGSFPGHS